jgi:uncharacterized protein YjiS (DUF1127 family)
MFPMRLVKAFATYRRRRRPTLELGLLSDHHLNDIGITRYDLFASQHSIMVDRHGHR